MTPNQDASAAEPRSEAEAWFDAEIGPALEALAQRCRERGMSFVASVEYEPGSRAGTYSVLDGACLATQMVALCSKTAPNVDSYVISLVRLCAKRGVDAGGSMVLRQLISGRDEPRP